MAKTQPRGTQVLDGTIARDDLDATTAGQAVIRKAIAGTGISLSSTGPDAGTGDVTINATGGSSGTAVNQTSHGLVIGDVIRYNGTAYVEAKADTAANAEVIGIVTAVADANNFTFVAEEGTLITGLSGLTAGATYFLSAATAGLLTTTEPSTAGQVSKPLLNAVSTTTGRFTNMRGMLVTAAAWAPHIVNIGDGTATDIVVTHNLGSEDLSVEMKNNTTDKLVGSIDMDYTSTNAVTFHFSIAPTTNQYRVMLERLA